LDTSRHFLPKQTILDTLDLMEMNKFNVFHWHLTDDPSFPYESYTFPKLSQLGAYSERHTYSQSDVAEIIEAARLRGIRVMPEFDTPGHSESWGIGHPDILTECGASSGVGKYGPIEPTNESTYLFMDKLYKEIKEVFPDSYVHLGGDEVDKRCWQSNQYIVEFMRAKGWTDYKKLESYYVEKLTKIVESLNKTSMVWQEVFDNGDRISKQTVVNVWKGGWQQEVLKVAKGGFPIVVSAPFYLNYISYGADWPNYYKVDITKFGGTPEQQRLVIGGEACLWGEYINAFNLMPTAWPRASAVGEKLWSSQAGTTDVKDAGSRLEEHTCRMQNRGYSVQPASGPSFC